MRPSLRSFGPFPITVTMAAAAMAAGIVLGSAAPMRQAESVRAIRFRQLIVESGLDFVHGGGQWHDALFLPDRKLVAQVVWETAPGKAPQRVASERPRMYVYEGSLESELAARPSDHPDGRRAPEEIRIPAALADGIASLAALTKLQADLATGLARTAVAAKAVGGPKSVRPRFDGR